MTNSIIKSICIVNANQIIPELGGVERVCDILQWALLKNSVDVCSFFVKSYKPLKKNEYRILYPDRITCEENVQQFCNILIERNVQIILCQSHIGEQLRLCLEAKKRIPVKLVYTFHRNPLANVKEYSDYKDKLLNNSGVFQKVLIKCRLVVGYPYFLVKKMYDRVYECYDYGNLDAFITLSPSYRDYFVKHIAESYRKKVYSIFNPLRIEHLEEEIVKKKQILFVGRLTYQKRLDRLLVMWKQIQEYLPEWSLLILGEGDYSNKYNSLSHELELNNVSFLGCVSPFDYYKESSIICMTSSYEGLPMVLIEAQSCGCIPIAFDSFGALKDIIEDGYNGYIIPAFNKTKYIRTVIRLAKSDNLRKVMAKNALVSVEKFSDKEIVKEWIKLFERI